MTLGESIRELRKRRGLSQEKLAEQMGVSRQAVTKWEAGQSAPSSENLLRLAELLGTTAEALLGREAEGGQAEQAYALYQAAAAKAAAERRAGRNRRLRAALGAAGGYLLLYLLGRLWSAPGQYSLTGWLFGNSPGQLPYLYGWLLHQHLFWAAMFLSVLLALLGKPRFSFTTLGGFALGLALGELLGQWNAPPGYHYGWVIWAGIFLLSFPLGAVLERLLKSAPHKPFLKRKLLAWGAAALAGVLLILLLTFTGIPHPTGT